jgi:hypothetical protein
VFGPSITLIKWEIHFIVAAHKTIVAKVVGNGDMHNPPKYEEKN